MLSVVWHFGGSSCQLGSDPFVGGLRVGVHVRGYMKYSFPQKGSQPAGQNFHAFQIKWMFSFN